MIPQGLLSAIPQLKKNMPAMEEESIEAVDDNEKEEGEGLTEKNKKDWNAYLGWLEEKKLRGKPELDKNDLGNKLFKQYLKENPETTLSVDIIPDVRKEYIKLRDASIQDILSGKISFLGKKGAGTDTSGFMSHIVQNEKTTNPNYVGQHLTQTMFPYLGEKISTKPGMADSIKIMEEVRNQDGLKKLQKLK